MRILIASAAMSALYLAGCHSGRTSVQPSRVPDPPPRIIAERLSRVIEQQQRAATIVDTIQLKRTTINLRVGKSFNLLNLAPVARDTAGKVVAPFSPVFVRGASTVYTLVQGLDVRALSAGVDSLYVEALPPSPSRPRQRPSTRVLIVVRP